MANLRFQVVEEAFKKKPLEVIAPVERPSEYFGKYVFNRAKMYKYLPADVYDKLIDVIDNGTRLDRSIADAVAAGMKQWAEENGVTHYTHWFQPLTEGTALTQARSPTAASETPSRREATRHGTPRRPCSSWTTRSASRQSSSHTRARRSTTKLRCCAVCHYFDPNVKKVTCNLGWEQEYFLVDEGLYSARPDLMLTGRTLMGHDSAKNQQMDDHYFGTIPDRVQAFMKDLEIQALELSIPCKTRHNEVAPNSRRPT